MDCMFFDKTKSEERFKTFDGAEAQKELNLSGNPHRSQGIEPEYYSFEATMGRILEVVEAMNPSEKPIIHSKHKYFGGGCTMTDRFERYAMPEEDDLQIYKAARDVSRQRRPQTAPAGGRSASVGASAPLTMPASPGNENQSDVSQSQDAQKQEELNLKSELSERHSRLPLRPGSASRADTLHLAEVDPNRPYEVSRLPPRPRSASVSRSSKPDHSRPSKLPPRPKTAGVTRSSFEQAQIAEAQRKLQRPKSAIAISGSRCPADNDRSSQVQKRPRSALSTRSSLSRSHSCSSVSSCASTAASGDSHQHSFPAAAEWLGGNVNRRNGNATMGPAAFPKRLVPRTKSKVKAKAKEAPEFFPLCKDLSMYNGVGV
jgi:hypothetical protein